MHWGGHLSEAHWYKVTRHSKLHFLSGKHASGSLWGTSPSMVGILVAPCRAPLHGEHPDGTLEDNELREAAVR